MSRLKSNYPVHWSHSKHENIFVAGKQKNKLPPLSILNWIFRYDSESGRLYRVREASGSLCNPEREVAAINGNGYIQVGVTDSVGLLKWFKVHHIIFYMVSGEEPLSVVDHRDGDTKNNRFDNLLLTTGSGNSRNRKIQSNNTSGITGVSFNKKMNKWQSIVADNNSRKKYIGCFDSIETAKQITLNFRNEMGTYTIRHGV